MAEAVGSLAALLVVPEHIHLTIRTDSLASIGGVNRDRNWNWDTVTRGKVFAMSQRSRITQACRPVLSCIRALISRRSGNVHFLHVRAHTGSGDRHSLMNERADELANVARLAANVDDHSLTNPPVARDLYGQERVIVSVDDIEVTGSYRGALERMVWKQRLAELATSSKHSAAEDVLIPGDDPHPPRGRQARVAQTYGPGVMAWCYTAQRSRNPSQLKFAMEALATWLPTEATVMIGGHQGTHVGGSVASSVRPRRSLWHMHWASVRIFGRRKFDRRPFGQRWPS
jgi:hypothetical protein